MHRRVLDPDGAIPVERLHERVEHLVPEGRVRGLRPKVPLLSKPVELVRSAAPVEQVEKMSKPLGEWLGQRGGREGGPPRLGRHHQGEGLPLGQRNRQVLHLQLGGEQVVLLLASPPLLLHRHARGPKFIQKPTGVATRIDGEMARDLGLR
jgi:hypothetical protein